MGRGSGKILELGLPISTKLGTAEFQEPRTRFFVGINTSIHCVKSKNNSRCEVESWFQLVYECSLLMLLCVCVFHSLLALEKILVSFLLCSSGLALLWSITLSELTNRQFALWSLLNPEYINFTLLDQFDLYCRFIFSKNHSNSR